MIQNNNMYASNKFCPRHVAYNVGQSNATYCCRQPIQEPLCKKKLGHEERPASRNRPCQWSKLRLRGAQGTRRTEPTRSSIVMRLTPGEGNVLYYRPYPTEPEWPVKLIGYKSVRLALSTGLESTTIMAYTLEKKILSEFIQVYKELPCLWNTSHALYYNKVARNRAMDVLLEKYKMLDSMADKYKMKRKIDKMRSCYKRERNKVIKSKQSDGELYVPTLWYYDLMSFVYEVEPNDTNKTVHFDGNTSDNHDDDDDDDNDGELSEYHSAKRPKLTSIYVTENENESIEELRKSPTEQKAKKSSLLYECLTKDHKVYQEPSYSKNEPSHSLCLRSTLESDLFGRIISAQLNELRSKQRLIAEKLISDVIFFGRLNKLKTGTTLDLNYDCL